MNTGTGVYTAPVTGWYVVSTGCRFNADMSTTSAIVQALILVSGTAVAGNGNAALVTGTLRHSRVITASVYATKGTEITAGVTQGSSGSLNLEAAASPNFFSIMGSGDL